MAGHRSGSGAEPIGRVNRDERDLIRKLHLEKAGLAELFASLARMEDDEVRASQLYERLVLDMGRASVDYQDWWAAMAAKYGWPGQDGGAWRIDFDSCEVFLE